MTTSGKSPRPAPGPGMGFPGVCRPVPPWVPLATPEGRRARPVPAPPWAPWVSGLVPPLDVTTFVPPWAACPVPCGERLAPLEVTASGRYASWVGAVWVSPGSSTEGIVASSLGYSTSVVSAPIVCQPSGVESAHISELGETKSKVVGTGGSPGSSVGVWALEVWPRSACRKAIPKGPSPPPL